MVKFFSSHHFISKLLAAVSVPFFCIKKDKKTTKAVESQVIKSGIW